MFTRNSHTDAPSASSSGWQRSFSPNINELLTTKEVSYWTLNQKLRHLTWKLRAGLSWKPWKRRTRKRNLFADIAKKFLGNGNIWQVIWRMCMKGWDTTAMNVNIPLRINSSLNYIKTRCTGVLFILVIDVNLLQHSSEIWQSTKSWPTGIQG